MVGVAAPLIVVLAILGWASFRVRRSDALQQQELIVSREAEALAGRFEAEMRALAQVAKSNAAILSTYPNLSEQEIYELLERSLDQNALVYGAAIAFEPTTQGTKARAPYVFRTGVGAGSRGTTARKDVAQSYDYTTPQWEWYARAKSEGVPIWTEPYYDDGGGDAVMCTFSAPFFHLGKFLGVATIDVRLTDLDSLAQRPARRSEWIVVLSAGGTLVQWPEPERVRQLMTYEQMSTQFDRPELHDVGLRMTRQESGVARVRDFADASRELMVAYQPIPSTRWSLAVAVDEQRLMGGVYTELRDRAFASALILALVTLTVLGIGWWIMRPLRTLTEGVSALGAGNLDAPPVRVRTHDEIGDLARTFNRMLRQLKQRVQDLTEATRQREAVLSELRVAREIQSSLLPRLDPDMADNPDFRMCAINAPARAVAGDFYDFFVLPDGRLAFLIADVSGKGVPASLFMAVARTVVRDLATRGESPGNVLAEANRRLLADNQSGLFVTIFIGYFDRTTGRVTYANGGHQLPYVVSPANIRRFGHVTGTIVGVLKDQAFTADQDVVQPGESLVLYTDGVPDARHTGTGEFFGEERLASTLRDFAQSSTGIVPSRVCNELVQMLDQWQGETRSDDVTILVLTRSGS